MTTKQTNKRTTKTVVRQFKKPKKQRTFYDRKVIHSNTTRALCLGKIIPKPWQYVRIEVLNMNEDSRTVKITKLLGDEENAQSTKTNKKHKQNT